MLTTIKASLALKFAAAAAATAAVGGAAALTDAIDLDALFSGASTVETGSDGSVGTDANVGVTSNVGDGSASLTVDHDLGIDLG